MSAKPVDALYCSFCGKCQHEVRQLIAGPTVYICDECAMLCVDIVHEENAKSNLRKEMRDKKQVIVSEADASLITWVKTWAVTPPRTGE